MEKKYRRVITLCTGVSESDVDAMMAGLIKAVESEGDGGSGDVGRVREFLRRVGEVA